MVVSVLADSDDTQHLSTTTKKTIVEVWKKKTSFYKWVTEILHKEKE